MDPNRERVALTGCGVASGYAAALLATLGVPVERVAGEPDPHPDALWAASGAMALTGHPGGPPLLAPGPLAACARGALQALRALAPNATLPSDGPALLGERARFLGITRSGRHAPGGSCRLLRCADGWIAPNLARAEDVASLPAWLEAPVAEPTWEAVATLVATRSARELVQRATWLSLPCAIAGPPAAHPPDWLRVERLGVPAERAPDAHPLVVDLTTLWAGPLTTSLLAAIGARVVKVESTGRPDGARRGPTEFFDLLNADKASVALDFRAPADRARLRALIARADIVVESARPRALAQLGIDARAHVAGQPGRTWLSLTGYGRRDPEPGRVAFGDDASVAAGLAEATGRDEGAPLFCGDAIADPLAGLHAALAAAASWRSGGGQLLDLALRDVVAHALAFPSQGDAGFGPTPVRPPRARAAARPARPLGADTAHVLETLGIRC